MEISPEEKAIFITDSSEWSLNNIYFGDEYEYIMSQVSEYMVELHYVNGEIPKSLEASYEIARRVVDKVLSQRTRGTLGENSRVNKIKPKEIIALEDILTDDTNQFDKLPSDIMEGFSADLFEDQTKLMEFISQKTDGLNLTQIEWFDMVMKDVVDRFRRYMTIYITQLSENFHSLVAEADGKGTSQFTDEQLEMLLRFTSSWRDLAKYKINGRRMLNFLGEKASVMKLESFKSNKEFYDDLLEILEHDKKKHVYWFHGTQSVVTAQMIMSEGLAMERQDIESTAYSEYQMDTVEKLLLYSRGFDKAIGSSAIVIVDQPIDENGRAQDIVEPIGDRKIGEFVQSGLSGFGAQGGPNFIVDPKYIVGFINKEQLRIEKNTKYYDYKKTKNTLLSQVAKQVNEKNKSPR